MKGFMFKGKEEPLPVVLRLVVDDDEAAADEPDSLVAELHVDGRRLAAFDHGPVDLVELGKSLDQDGEYFIWTCECGVPECGGRHKGVRVRHLEDRVQWKDLDTDQGYCFELDELRRAMARVLREGQTLIAGNADLETTPDSNLDFFKTEHSS